MRTVRSTPEFAHPTVERLAPGRLFGDEAGHFEEGGVGG